MKITFINPKWECTNRLYPRGHGRYYHYASPSIPILSSLTKGIEKDYINEFYEDVDIEAIHTDIAAITFFTPQANRAYELSSKLREKGITTIGGGIHVSLMPDEAAKHFDSVVIGEAESIWETVLNNFKTNSLKNIYIGKHICSWDKYPFPDREIFDKYGYQQIQPVQTSRGCYFTQCPTCIIPEVFGKKIRIKTPQRVRKEIQTIKDKFIYFGDDHFIWGDFSYAYEVFEQIKNLNKYIMISGALSSISKSPKLLETAYNAGCRIAYIALGFDPETNRGIFKHYDRLVRQIKTLKSAGILPIVSIIFGLDHDDSSVFQRSIDFCLEAEIELIDFGIMNPFPKTPFYNKCLKENRIIHSDWSKYNYMHPVFTPKNMSVEELEQGFYYAWKKFYKYRDESYIYSDLFANANKIMEKYVSPLPKIDTFNF